MKERAVEIAGMSAGLMSGTRTQGRLGTVGALAGKDPFGLPTTPLAPESESTGSLALGGRNVGAKDRATGAVSIVTRGIAGAVERPKYSNKMLSISFGGGRSVDCSELLICANAARAGRGRTPDSGSLARGLFVGCSFAPVLMTLIIAMERHGQRTLEPFVKSHPVQTMPLARASSFRLMSQDNCANLIRSDRQAQVRVTRSAYKGSGGTRVSDSVPDELVEAIKKVRAEPHSQDAWDAADEAVRATERPEEISKLYREYLATDLPKDLVGPLGERAVAFHEEWFEDTSHVIGVLRRVLEMDPAQEWAFERLSLMLTMAERWDDLLAEYDRALATANDAESKQRLLDEAARIAKDFAGQSNRAIGYLKDLVPLRPEDAQLAQSLERRLVLQKRHRDLIDVWNARLPVLDSAEALATRVRIAETWLEKLNDAETALEVVLGLLEDTEGEESGCRLLEKIGVREEAPARCRRSALTELKNRFAARSLSKDVIRAIELLLLVAENNEELIALRTEARDRLAEDGDVRGAVAHGAELLVLSPGAPARDRLHELVEITGEFEVFANSLVRAAEHSHSAVDAVAFTIEAGVVCEDRLGDRIRAIKLFSSALRDPAANAEAQLDVSRRLSALLVEEEHEPALLTVLERRADLEPEAKDMRAVVGQAATLAEKLGDADHALVLWKKRLASDPSDIEALDASVAILDRNQRWESLIAALRKRADAHGTNDREARRADLVRIAEVHQRKLEDVEGAIAVWQEIQDEFDASAETVDALANLSAAARRWTDVVGLLRTAADREDDPERRTNQLARMGDVYREQRNSPARAVESYREALGIDCRHQSARDGLLALIDNAEAGADAVETLARAYAEADEWQGTLELVERRIARAEDATFRCDVLLEAARIEEDRAQNQRGALVLVRRAFALLPEPLLESELIRLAEETAEWAEAATGYKAALDNCSDKDRLRQLLFEHGRILDSRLGNYAGALKSFERVLEMEPSNLVAACSAVRVACLVSDWDSAASTLVQYAAASGGLDSELISTFDGNVTAWDPFTVAVDTAYDRASGLSSDTEHELQRQLGIWHRDRRMDAGSAEAAFEQAVASKPVAETLAMLADLQRQTPNRKLVATLLKLAEVTEHDLEVLHEAGNVALLAIREVALAEPILEKVRTVASERWREADGDSADAERFALWAIDRLVEIRLEAKDGASALRLLVAGARLPCTSEVSRSLRFRAAEIAAEELGDASKAIELCASVLDEAPDDGEVIALLASLYSAEGRLDDLLQLRRRELALEPGIERRLDLRLDIARVLGELGNSTDERVEVLKDNLADRPGHAPSVDDIGEILEVASRQAELLDILSEQAKAVQELGDASVAAALWARAGHLAEEPIGDVPRALDAYRRSVDLEPSFAVLDALARIQSDRGEHAVAVRWLERRLERTGTGPDDLADYRDTVLRLAHAQARAGQEEQARDTLTRALADDPAARRLREFLATLYREAGDWKLLAPLLAEGVEYVSDAASKIELLTQAAQVQRRRLDAIDDAIPLLERAVQLAPGDQATRLTLADALRIAERFDEARALLDALLEEFGRRRTPERASVHFHLARIARAEGKLDEALEQLESASNIVRSDPHVLRLLGDVAREKGELDRAERAYRALLLIVRRQQASDDADDIVAASEILYELYRMASEQGQGDRANDLLESAFETAAENNLEALRLERLFRATGQTQLVLRVLDTRLDRIEEPAAAADILCARADLLADTGRLDEALDSLLSALSRTPDSEALLKATYDLALRAGSLEHFANQLSTLAENALSDSPDRASALWLRAGKIAEQELASPGRAADFYQSALRSGARAFRAFRALERCLPAGDDERRASVLRDFVQAPEDDRGDPSVLTDALYELAGIELTRAESVEQGAAHLEQALGRESRHSEARHMLVQGTELAPDNVRLVRLFERVAREIGEAPLLFEALCLASKLPDVSLDLLRDAMHLSRSLGNDSRTGELLERAVTVAEQAGAIDDVVPSLIDLAARKEADGDIARAVDLLQKASAASAPGDAFELSLKVAELAAGSLEDHELAARTYERLLEREPAEPRVYRPLLETYRRLGAADQLERCIAKTVDAVYDPVERNRLRMERGRILLESGRIEEAEAALRDVLDEDPDHLEASVVLCDLFEKTGRTEELNELLEHQLTGAQDRGDTTAVATLALKIGQNHESAGRVQEALQLYRESLGQAPEDRDLLRAVLRLGPDDDPGDRAELMERLLEVEEGEAAAELAIALASLRDSAGDEAAAWRAVERGFRACPERRDLRERLVTQCEQEGRFEDLANVLLFDAEHRDSQEEAVAIYRSAASIFGGRLSDSARAADVLALAFRLAPSDVELLTEVIDALMGAGRAEAAFDTIGNSVEDERVAADVRSALLVRRASLRLEIGETTPEAIATAIADLDRAAALGADNLLPNLAEMLEKQRALAAELAEYETEREATMRLVQILPSLGDQRRGLELLVGWVKSHPDDAAAVRELGQFAADAEKWGAAAKAYLRLFEMTDGDEQLDAALRLADACERADKPMDAKPALEEVYRREPSNQALQGRLRRMYESAGAYQELAELMIAEAEQATDDSFRFKRFLEAGDLSCRVPGGEQAAVAAYQRALSVNPEDHTVVIRLADVLSQIGEIEQAANLLDTAINSYGKRRSPELSELQHCMARVGRAAEDFEAVFAWLEAAVQSDRQNGSAAAELAVVAMQQGELDAAVRALQAVTLLKEPGPMSRAEAYLRQGMIADQKGDRRKAVFLAKRALTSEPEYNDAKVFLEQLGEA